MKDYTRKGYRSRKGYFDTMHGIPARAFWNTITEAEPQLSEYGGRGVLPSAIDRRFLQFLKQSEAKKPYLDNDYAEMEYEWEGIPGLIDWPTFDHPWMPDPQPPGIFDIIEPLLFVLRAFTEDDYCKGTTTEILVKATEPIYEIAFQWPGLMDPLTTFTIASPLGQPQVLINLFVPTSESSIMRMKAYLRAFDALPPPSTQGQGWTDFTVDEERDLTVCPVFTFSLTMADGDPADGGESIAFSVRDSTGAAIPSLATWDATISKWVLQINDDPIDPNGYWVDYQNNSLTGNHIKVKTLYPFKYKTSDFTNNANLIAPGDYTDEIHVIKWDSTVTLEPDGDSGIAPCDADLGTDWTTRHVITGGNNSRTTEDQKFFYNVFASAEYTTTWEFDDFDNAYLYCRSFTTLQCNGFAGPIGGQSCPSPPPSWNINFGTACLSGPGWSYDNTGATFIETFTSISGSDIHTMTETNSTCAAVSLIGPSWGAQSWDEDQTSPSLSGNEEGFDFTFSAELIIDDQCCQTGIPTPTFLLRQADWSYLRYHFDIGSGKFNFPSFDVDVLLT